MSEGDGGVIPDSTLIDAKTKNINLEIAAREPWPETATLYLPLKDQLVVWSSECLATLCLLRKALVPSLRLEHVRNAAEMSNSGIPPVLSLNNRIFSEFDEIADLLELKGLLSENGRNTDVRTWSTSYSILCTEVIRGLMNYFLISTKTGLVRTCTSKFETTIKALSEKIQNNQGYLLSQDFTRADAHLYGCIYSILNLNIMEYNELNNIIHRYQPLIEYVRKIDRFVQGFSVIDSISGHYTNTVGSI
ncbi:unnamed protein product [Didymodactylos carnosus]|uniref:Uncharacterized protein n=1 Tax=Didymodactylos carnosus TaxID=1234261 RepID=A0A814ASW2_9BILA|nr:unnamed protein product [Didymodactylos carnosus]CAF3698831.1 unnamed protein product [Didymodactylos carnosus]